MNTLRTNFILPLSHKIVITPYWLLGFIEGDGSFSVSTLKSFPLRFNIVQSIVDKKVMEEIKLFLLNLPGNASYKLKKVNSNPVQIIEENFTRVSENRKLLLSLNINDHSFLINILIPFFSKLQFLTKKELDFKDWKNILNLKTHGWHLSTEGANLIKEISRNMNNKRLSTNHSILKIKQAKKSNDSKLPKLDEIPTTTLNLEKTLQSRTRELILDKVKNLLNQPSNFEIYPDGKIYIKSEQKFWKGRGDVVIDVYNKEGILLYSLNNLEATANFFNVKEHIIKYRLNSGKPLIISSNFIIPSLREQEVYFKRSIIL